MRKQLIVFLNGDSLYHLPHTHSCIEVQKIMIVTLSIRGAFKVQINRKNYNRDNWDNVPPGPPIKPAQWKSNIKQF